MSHILQRNYHMLSMIKFLEYLQLLEFFSVLG